MSHTITIAPAPLTVTAPTFYTHDGYTFYSWPVTASGWVGTDGSGSLAGSQSCSGPWTSGSYTYLGVPETISGTPGSYPTTCTGFAARNYQVTEVPGTVTILPNGTPEPPTSVVAKGGVDEASVSWTAPSDAVDTYTVTSTPGAKTCTATSVAGCTVTGLTPGTQYTFTVTSTTTSVTGPASNPSNTVLVTATAPGTNVGAYSLLSEGKLEIYCHTQPAG